jgi:hypothetical protein
MPSLDKATLGANDPLRQFYSRELLLGTMLLTTIQRDLAALIEVSQGAKKLTNETRLLLSSIVKGMVPSAWQLYQCSLVSLSAWISDFIKRLDQLKRVVELGDWRSSISLGRLFNPLGFITASQQVVSRESKCSLERLSLSVSLEAIEESGFIIESKS